METPCDITQEDTMFDVEMVSLSIPPFTSSFSLSQDHDSTQADPTPLITATPTLCPDCLRPIQLCQLVIPIPGRHWLLGQAPRGGEGMLSDSSSPFPSHHECPSWVIGVYHCSLAHCCQERGKWLTDREWETGQWSEQIGRLTKVRATEIGS